MNSSPGQIDKSRFTLGTVTRPRGLRGEFFLNLPVERDLAKGTLVRVNPPGTEYALQSISHAKDRALVKLAGVDTVEAAEALRGAVISVPREALGPELMIEDLFGCSIFDAGTGREIGIVKSCLKNPGHDLLELESGMLIPFVPAFFPEIDVAARRLVARLPQGLDEL